MLKLKDRYRFVKTLSGSELGMPDGRTINVSFWDEDPIYDTVTIPASITSGSKYDFFRDLENKGMDKTNMVMSSRLPEGWQIYVWYIAFMPTPQTSSADWEIIASKGYFELIVNGSKRRSGPIWTTQSVATSYGFPSIFNKSLDFPILLTGSDTFQATLTFYEDITLSASVDMVCMLWGWINRSVGG